MYEGQIRKEKFYASKKWLLALYSLWITSLCSAQALSTIQGSVIDARTKQPLTGAVVYLANTAIGVYANEDGTFLLEKIPPGKYDLTVSMLGYKTRSVAIEFPEAMVQNHLIKLEPTVTQLDSVSVHARKMKQRPGDYNKFLKYFLGRTDNARHCRITNPEDVFVYRDGGQIIALASKTIQVENQALGYRVHYELKEFIYDAAVSSVTFSGIPRFEELIPSSPKQKKVWTRERDRAYFGSVPHFLTSIIDGKLDANYFEVTNTNGTRLQEKDLMLDSLVYYHKPIYVTFKKERPEGGYPSRFRTSRQESPITFPGQPIKVYQNGYFEDFHSIIFGGYIGWSSSIAELLPLGYQPSYKITPSK